MLRDVAGGIGLDEEIEVAGLVVTRDGSVGSYNFFLGLIRLFQGGCNRDMLADGET